MLLVLPPLCVCVSSIDDVGTRIYTKEMKPYEEMMLHWFHFYTHTHTSRVCLRIPDSGISQNFNLSSVVITR